MSETKICFKQVVCKNPNPQPIENFYAHPKMADGTSGTVVYNGLDGVGIRYGHFDLTDEQKERVKF